MPRGDGTGPMGAGPMTGRGAGYCAGYAAPGYVNSGYGCFRPGGGRGRGIRRMYHATGLPAWQRFGGYSPVVPVAPIDQKTMLQQQAESLENELKYVRDQLNGFEEKE